MRNTTITLCGLLLSTSIYGQQFKLSSDFKRFSEKDDTPGLIERYKDAHGHKYIVFAEGRSIQSDNPDTALIEGLDLAFDGYNKPARTKDGFYVSTGQIQQPKSKYKFYYIIYAPKTMESFSIFSYETDATFKTCSEKLLRLIRSDKNMF